MRFHEDLLQSYNQSVEEAIRGARSAGDVQCLKHCTRYVVDRRDSLIVCESKLILVSQPAQALDGGDATSNDDSNDSWSGSA